MSHRHAPLSNLPSVRQPVLLGLFAGTAIGAGYLLAGVPNVELMTLIIALCGGTLGARAGIGVGILSAVVYSLGSPYGVPVPLMLAAQAAGLAAAGGVGALGAHQLQKYHSGKRRWGSVIWAAGLGLVCTSIYDLLTNLAIVGAFDLQLALVFWGAIPFFLLHVGSNAALFGTLMPILLPRLQRHGRPALVARLPLAGCLIFLPLMAVTVLVADGRAEVPPLKGAAAAPSDSLLASTHPVATENSNTDCKWQRPLWTPFAATMVDWLGWYSAFSPVIDGGLGAPVAVLGEIGTSLRPTYVRDGVPLGTGHFMTDDPWLVPMAGLKLDPVKLGLDQQGGTDGLIATRTADPHPEQATSAYRGVRGRHESYFRSLHLLTPKASWRAAFEFEESLDIEGYNPSGLPDADFIASSGIDFPGHSRIRQSRARLFRELDHDNRLTVEYSTGRLTKDHLPAYGAEHLELWDTGVATKMALKAGNWHVNTNLYWRNNDVRWGDRADNAIVGGNTRHLDVGREGVDVRLRTPRSSAELSTQFRLQADHWHLDDSLTAATWLEPFTGDKQGQASSLRASGRSQLPLGPMVGTFGAGLLWHSTAGAGLEGEMQLAAPGSAPWWLVNATYGGRAPRSDELLTPLQRTVAARRLRLWPNPDLTREKTARVGLELASQVLGFDLALDASLKQVRQGITWRVATDDPNAGRWANDLDMVGSRLAARLGRQGRLAGWVRAEVEGIWQTSSESRGRAAFLPPARVLRAHVMWENHFFQEDGIVQIALFSTVRGPMADPWDVTRSAQLPVLARHDLVVGFRLLGADLSLAIRNLTGERLAMTSGAVSPGQEVEMRLHWAWIQ